MVADSVVGGLSSSGVGWPREADGGLVMRSDGDVGAGGGGQAPDGAVAASGACAGGWALAVSGALIVRWV